MLYLEEEVKKNGEIFFRIIDEKTDTAVDSYKFYDIHKFYYLRKFTFEAIEDLVFTSFRNRSYDKSEFELYLSKLYGVFADRNTLNIKNMIVLKECVQTSYTSFENDIKKLSSKKTLEGVKVYVRYLYQIYLNRIQTGRINIEYRDFRKLFETISPDDNYELLEELFFLTISEELETAYRNINLRNEELTENIKTVENILGSVVF